jgi:hypothetical protein
MRAYFKMRERSRLDDDQPISPALDLCESRFANALRVPKPVSVHSGKSGPGVPLWSGTASAGQHFLFHVFLDPPGLALAVIANALEI